MLLWLAVDYVWPDDSDVSAECKDLVSKILVASPAQRISIASIQQHPWFQVISPYRYQQLRPCFTVSEQGSESLSHCTRKMRDLV